MSCRHRRVNGKQLRDAGGENPESFLVFSLASFRLMMLGSVARYRDVSEAAILQRHRHSGGEKKSALRSPSLRLHVGVEHHYRRVEIGKRLLGHNRSLCGGTEAFGSLGNDEYVTPRHRLRSAGIQQAGSRQNHFSDRRSQVVDLEFGSDDLSLQLSSARESKSVVGKIAKYATMDKPILLA